MVAIELPSPWRPGQASWPDLYDSPRGFRGRSKHVQVDSFSRHTSGVIREMERMGMSLDYGELSANADENAVEQLLRGAAISQLGASLNQRLACCQCCFLREVADTRHDG